MFKLILTLCVALGLSVGCDDVREVLVLNPGDDSDNTGGVVDAPGAGNNDNNDNNDNNEGEVIPVETIIELSTTILEVGDNGGEVTFITTTNIQYEVESDESWISVIDGATNRSTEDYIVSLQVAKNSGVAREGVVRITYYQNDKYLSSIKIKVIQGAYIPPVSEEINNLTVSWSPDVTREQHDIVSELIKNMVLVNGGTFDMGSYDDNAYTLGNVAHSVSLSDFQIGKYEVMQSEWEVVMGDNPSYFKRSDCPVENISWNECQEFVSELNRITGLSFRLPTEAEWEFAARGGNYSNGYEYSGSDAVSMIAWFSDNSVDKTHTVGTKIANELGLYDMSGNVAEWCSDWYAHGYYSLSPQNNPQGPDSGTNRVHRGGSWSRDARPCVVSARKYCNPDLTYNYLGLRLVLSVDDSSNDEQGDDSEDEEITITWASEVTDEQKEVLTALVQNVVYVEGGTFTMGATSSDSEATADEMPAHSVTLSSYRISKYEVTQREWLAVVGSNPSYFSGDNLPVEQVSWDDVVNDFLPELNRMTGLRFRLPTEAEWEFAARGGNKTRGYKYSGANTLNYVAWNSDNSDAGNGKTTHPVGQKQSNELGLYDMTGNVWEWCSDLYDDSYYSSSPDNNPQGPETGSSRVRRGGGYGDPARPCRVTNRYGNESSYIIRTIGFRLAL